MGSPHEDHAEKHQNEHQESTGNNNDNHSENPPPPPEPSNDAGIVPPIRSPTLQALDHLTVENVDIFTLDPVAALKLLCRGTQALCDMTGDVPPTPMLQGRSPAASSCPAPEPASMFKEPRPVQGFSARNENDHIDGVPFQRTPIGSPEAHPHEAIVHGSTAQPAVVQYAALVRKFYSKRPPPISLEDYLSRMHKYCPMSTAVYLATSHYITHLAVTERICPVTPRNVHRLVLAGLRIAMKALEDLSWPHGRFAKVGGISEAELARLEIGFCFLMDFGLKVDESMLVDQARFLVQMNSGSAVTESLSGPGGLELTLPEPRKKKTGQGGGDGGDGNENGGLMTPRTAEKRKASSSLPMRPVQHVGQGIGIVGQS